VFLTELADALKHNGPVATLVPLQQALSEYDDAILELRRDRRIVPLTAEETERVFGTAFALQQLVRNLVDLTERVSELTAGR
jgi:antitoxin (DNA-binding transcriptional repressor) of toxin-antitoxin stability system